MVVYSGSNTDCKSSEPLKTIVMLCYVMFESIGYRPTNEAVKHPQLRRYTSTKMCLFLLFFLLSQVLVELVPTFSPGLNGPRSNCYNTRQCTAAVAVTPWSSSCFCSERESLENLTKEREQTNTDRQTDFSNTRPMECRQRAAASGLCSCLCQPPHRGREIDEDSDR